MSENADDKLLNDKYLDRLFDAYSESAKQFDKQILYIASGSIGISFSFIQKIVDLSKSGYNWLLITSWITLTIVVLLSLTSHYIAFKALNKQLELFYQENKIKAQKLNNVVKFLNISMIALLILGIALLILFVGINIL